jgi:hypothetical protein
MRAEVKYLEWPDLERGATPASDLQSRHLMFVSSINTELVEETVRDRLRRIDGDTWTELAMRIGRIGFWEFEDYTPAH